MDPAFRVFLHFMFSLIGAALICHTMGVLPGTMRNNCFAVVSILFTVANVVGLIDSLIMSLNK